MNKYQLTYVPHDSLTQEYNFFDKRWFAMGFYVNNF
jgi:hypothetical protein